MMLVGPRHLAGLDASYPRDEHMQNSSELVLPTSHVGCQLGST